MHHPTRVSTPRWPSPTRVTRAPGSRVIENKHSIQDRSKTYLHGECSYSCNPPLSVPTIEKLASERCLVYLRWTASSIVTTGPLFNKMFLPIDSYIGAASVRESSSVECLFSMTSYLGQTRHGGTSPGDVARRSGGRRPAAVRRGAVTHLKHPRDVQSVHHAPPLHRRATHITRATSWNAKDGDQERVFNLTVGSDIEAMLTNPVRPIRNVHYENPAERLADIPTGS
jgi:hypothetical protein